MGTVEKALTEKLSGLSVGTDFIPETDVVKDSGSKRRRGGMHLEADFGGEQDCGIDSRGAMSGVESSCEEVKQELTENSYRPSCSNLKLQERQEEEAALCTEHSDDLPDGFLSILPYADLKSLLTLERVSKQMRSRVNDVLVWRKLEVDRPLNRALTDDILMTLVKRAGGLLKSMRLVTCLWITDEGLANALSLCPQLEKLDVPGCIQLNINALVHTVEQHCAMSRSKGMSGIKQLQILGKFKIQEQNEFTKRDMILRANGLLTNTWPLYQSPTTWPVYLSSSTIDDDRAKDVEMCPMCDSHYATVVFDCTRKSCQNAARVDPIKACRDCFISLPSCSGCGTCLLVDDEEFKRACCRRYVCFSCWAQSPKCAKCNTAICRRHKKDFMQRTTLSASSGVCERCAKGWEKENDFSEITELCLALFSDPWEPLDFISYLWGVG
ncbi:hypothetical protein MPTK1_5g15410 [Marchantia polymorpha subsp. ruderalis]|uniref:F-box domain-containing protein n=2 Tax=Marchantia polymorpha TaxID=3197 RepID=A0A176VSY6_MARPO|nr:hypothetical protein AXG93_1217s1610 [Marchantia polymorpha subsp. ruderalis]PTQ35454.1 hypothetical protein MARPO_0071s0068 [Marchantia polymorpha]BBN11866.1 hypothetical protein Mp_5g15410 [Marchantia polymorpha subsp. ruderalis]|eukprot:PTQ35454.1 hypothetical protein MARPO_0071s0068 [Marchantia polymorpha]